MPRVSWKGCLRDENTHTRAWKNTKKGWEGGMKVDIGLFVLVCVRWIFPFSVCVRFFKCPEKVKIYGNFWRNLEIFQFLEFFERFSSLFRGVLLNFHGNFHFNATVKTKMDENVSKCAEFSLFRVYFHFPHNFLSLSSNLTIFHLNFLIFSLLIHQNFHFILPHMKNVKKLK